MQGKVASSLISGRSIETRIRMPVGGGMSRTRGLRNCRKCGIVHEFCGLGQDSRRLLVGGTRSAIHGAVTLFTAPNADWSNHGHQHHHHHDLHFRHDHRCFDASDFRCGACFGNGRFRNHGMHARRDATLWIDGNEPLRTQTSRLPRESKIGQVGSLISAGRFRNILGFLRIERRVRKIWWNQILGSAAAPAEVLCRLAGVS